MNPWDVMRIIIIIIDELTIAPLNQAAQRCFKAHFTLGSQLLSLMFSYTP